MFKELVKSIIAYRKEKQLLSLQLSETLKKNIQEDIISAFELSKPLVSHHIKLFRSSNSFFDFLLKLIDVDLKEEFVGRDDYVQQNFKKFEDEHKKNENYEYKIKQITEENDACQKELKKCKSKIEDAQIEMQQLEEKLKKCTLDKSKFENELKLLKLESQKYIELKNDLDLSKFNYEKCTEEKFKLKEENYELQNKLTYFDLALKKQEKLAKKSYEFISNLLEISDDVLNEYSYKDLLTNKIREYRNLLEQEDKKEKEYKSVIGDMIQQDKKNKEMLEECQEEIKKFEIFLKGYQENIFEIFDETKSFEQILFYTKKLFEYLKEFKHIYEKIYKDSNTKEHWLHNFIILINDLITVNNKYSKIAKVIQAFNENINELNYMDWGNSNTVEEALNIIITSKISCDSELNHLHNQIGILRDENNKLNKELQHTVSVKREEEDLFKEHKEKHKDLQEKLINCLKKIDKLESNEQNLNVEKLDLQKELKIRNNNIIELTQLQEENERLKKLVEQLNQNKNEINANYNKKYYELTKTISDNNTVIENLETENKRIKEKLEIENKRIEENREIENKRIEENLDDEEQYTEEIKANKKRKVNINVLNESEVLYTVNKMENDTLRLDQIISLFLNLYVHLSDLYFKHKCDSRLLNTEKALFRIEKLIEELDENKTELTYEYILAQFVHLEILTITDLKFEMKNPKKISVEELLNASLKSSSMYIDSVFEKINNSLKVIIKAFDENRIEFHENNVELMLKTYFLLKNKFQSQKIEISYENTDHLLSMYNTIQGALKTKNLEETLSKLIILQNKISSLFEKYKKEERDKSFSDWLFDQLETISKSFSKVRSGYKKL